MLAIASQLAQILPTDTVVNTAYTAVIKTDVTLIIVCNVSTNARKFSIYHDDDGTTFDDTTALYKDEPIAASTTRRIEIQYEGGGISVEEGGAIGVKTDVASELNFTLYGMTQNIAGVQNA